MDESNHLTGEKQTEESENVSQDNNANGQSDTQTDVPDNAAVLHNVVRDLPVLVNRQPVVLKNKAQYIFVDILDFYPFDMSVMGGSELVILKNGQKAEFTTPVAEGDNLEIFWK